MILTEAKKRAQQEFDWALAQTALTVEQARACEARYPTVRRATHRINHHGVAGTSANYLYDLARCR
jgi:hypothetical protein